MSNSVTAVQTAPNRTLTAGLVYALRAVGGSFPTRPKSFRAATCPMAEAPLNAPNRTYSCTSRPESMAIDSSGSFRAVPDAHPPNGGHR
jgi:hypothetical protein